MSNKQIAIALALSLESAAILAGQLADSLQDADNEVVGNRIDAILDGIFARRPAAVTPQETVPAFVEAPPVPAVQTPLEIVMDMLEDPRYTLRSLASLAEKSGLSEGDVIYELNDHIIDFVERAKRGSGAKLIGLTYRN